jgi:DNA-binding NarL/FixJ family response regulator
MSAPIRVLIADDHAIFREGLAALLASVDDIDVVGEAATGRDTIEQAKSLAPDVVLLDVMMPDLNGIEAAKQILEVQAGAKIVMLTMLEDDDSLFAAMRAGARGYVLKGANKAEVLQTLRAVADGHASFGPVMATRLTTFFQNLEPVPPEGNAPIVFPELTEREREVLDLIAAGSNNQAIADQLHISLKTVSNHISNIFDKLQVADRAQAIIRAREVGMGQNDGFTS